MGRGWLVTGVEWNEGLWGSGDVIFLELGGGYIAGLTLWKFTDLYTYTLCTSLNVGYTLVIGSLKNNLKVISTDNFKSSINITEERIS